MKKYLIIIILAIILIGGGAYWSLTDKPADLVDTGEPNQPDGIVCAMDVKECPDGSFVKRVPPECEFEKCLSGLTLQEETQIGFIKKVYEKDGKHFLDIDYIQWLTGNEAITAYREDEVGGAECKTNPDLGGCTPPNGYYIRNQNNQIRTFEISDSVTIKQIYFDDQGNKYRNLSLGEFMDTDTEIKGISKTKWDLVPFTINLIGNKVVEITEVYIP